MTGPAPHWLPPVWPAELPRRFSLWRDDDLTGLSGVGDVALGVCFSTGPLVLRWRGIGTEVRQLEIFDDLEQLVRVHGHGGRTRVVWLDERAFDHPTHGGSP